jgi:hypothetical protein
MGSKNWIAGAINPKTKGSFSAAAKKAGESTAEYAQEKSGASGKLGRRARLAQTLEKMRKK